MLLEFDTGTKISDSVSCSNALLSYILFSDLCLCLFSLVLGTVKPFLCQYAHESLVFITLVTMLLYFNTRNCLLYFYLQTIHVPCSCTCFPKQYTMMPIICVLAFTGVNIWSLLMFTSY